MLAAEARTRLRPRRRTELLRQRIHAFEQQVAQTDERLERQKQAVKQAKQRLAEAEQQGQQHQQQVDELEKDYQIGSFKNAWPAAWPRLASACKRSSNAQPVECLPGRKPNAGWTRPRPSGATSKPS